MNNEKLKFTPLNNWHEANGGKMVPFAGYNMPVRYSGDKEEHLAVRNSVGLFDVSHMGEFKIQGPEALDLIQYVFSNDASKLQNGEIQYGCLPNKTGGIVDDLLVYKVADHDYLLVVNASNIKKDYDWIVSNNTFDAQVTDISEQMALFALQGPKADEVLSKLVGEILSPLKYYTFTHYDIKDLKNVFVSATGYTGAGGYELMVSNEQAVRLWELIMEAGEEFEIKPIGLGARDTLRLEKGYCLYGNDIDDTTSPLEAGLSWVVKLNKETVASSWLEKQKEEGINKKLVGFVMEEKGIPRSHYEVLDINENTVGEVTSGTISPSLGYGIGMAYVNKGSYSVDKELFIRVRKKMLKAKVVKMPFL